ncbi:MAG: LLM class flavin-dependent oxidoreductase [Miltoncostaeaceae bacterium]
MTLPLSVLDLSPVPAGLDAPAALRNTLDLAARVEEMGYHRYWVAEHHNTPGMASSAPEVMIGQIAARTGHIRVGAGGIMLPNHSSLRIAETFRVLEALYPGRIDLGIGRAPGTDGITAAALRRTDGPVAPEDFPGQMYELLGYAGEGFPEGHPFARVNAEPRDVALPPVWLLGSSEYGAQAAAALGAGFAFARYLNPRDAAAICHAYRDAFTPSGRSASPRVILGLSVICAEDEDRARALAMSGALALVRMRQGRPAPMPSPEDAAAHDFTPAEADQVRRYLRAQVLGDPASVAAQIAVLAGQCAADEVMVMTGVHDHGARVESYRLLSQAWAGARVVSAR